MKKGVSDGENTILLGRSRNELEEWVLTEGQPAFRGRQIHEWLYEKGVNDLNQITVLPKAWRTDLQNKAVTIGRLHEISRQISLDATIKLLLETFDSEKIETVGIPTNHRFTVCVSSQVGCPMACRFCATGKGGLQRSLYAYEIVDQVLSVREAMGRRPSNVVFMGMGEPLLNIQQVLLAIRCLNDDLGIGQRRITISTVGIPNALPKLAESALETLGRAQFTLAVSLHASNQKLRETLIPSSITYPIQSLLEDCRKYISITGRRVTFEYILIGHVNDEPKHAEELAEKVRGFQSHVNLIAYNPIEEEEFQRPTNKRIQLFKKILEQKGVAVSIRPSRGLDQNAACGQLRSKYE